MVIYPTILAITPAMNSFMIAYLNTKAKQKLEVARKQIELVHKRCEYCGRETTLTKTNCEGCGAPK